MSAGAAPRRPTPRWRRRLAAAAVTLLVVLVHALLAQRIVEAWPQPADAGPARLAVTFVRTLQPQAPVPVVVAPVPKPRVAPQPAAVDRADDPAVAEAPDLPASAPPQPQVMADAAPAAPEATAAAPAPDEPPSAPPAGAPPALQVQGEAVATGPKADQVAEVAAAPAPAGSAVAFSWPPSTRMRYVLTGNYRGPIDGSAQVLWLREGPRYQVHLDVHIGPPFAALIERQMSSDGRLGPEGLVPRRYDERTHIAFRPPRALTLHFDADGVQLANGRRVPRPAGVQDAVSQFVQLTWRFTLDPGLLSTGRVIEMPLALPRRVETWVYDVGGLETLTTPLGAVEAVHVKPRREPRPGGDLVAEMWFAPTLQHLPVRIVIRQDAETWIDLVVQQLPEQAQETPAGPAPAVPSAPTPPPEDSPRRP
ncbi:DUF3108 domain-containing protein [Rubrivivax albus]|uniref:DUF3108 domain-containing protein n=1 Tax=Rubrivivax albus TaxID=2499835 RepID=A0A437JWN0_9BURK|nr:DUF3108 domain-containing protein [Rubrivivax albus]RVT52071.1 DUF3108 domain-containing protein [Rubrivivax albus]